jgi:hypothetical protein
MDVPRLEASKDCDMKKKLLVILIAAMPMLMPNLASAIAVDVGDYCATHPYKCVEPV